MSDKQEEEEGGLLHKVGHKAHTGVNFLILYELINKLHEYGPEWFEYVKTLLEGLRHAYIH